MLIKEHGMTVRRLYTRIPKFTQDSSAERCCTSTIILVKGIFVTAPFFYINAAIALSSLSFSFNVYHRVSLSLSLS